MHLVENSTHLKFDDKNFRDVSRGADEIDLVRSGLEETMIGAYQTIHDIGRQKNIDLRTAAFVSSVMKIGNDYQSMGIFP